MQQIELPFFAHKTITPVNFGANDYMYHGIALDCRAVALSNGRQYTSIFVCLLT